MSHDVATGIAAERNPGRVLDGAGGWYRREPIRAREADLNQNVMAEKEDGNDREGELEGEQEGEEARPAVALPGVPTVSAEERARHELTHMPFRAWCPHCVRGRGRNRPHLGKPKGKEEDVHEHVPKIAMDYFFASEADMKAALNPILVMVDETTGEKYARLVGKKGLGEAGEMEWLLKDLREELVSWGHAGGDGGKIILKSDSEAAIVAVREALARRHGGRVVPERPPPGEKQSNGVIEEAGRTVRCMAVTLKDALETKVKVKIQPGDVITEWIFRWAAMLCSRYLVGTDGRTAYERRRGRRCKVPVVSFGELVHFKELHPDGKRDKWASDWHFGVWLGHTRDSNEMLVGTEHGVRRTYAVKRLPEEERWNKDKVKNLVGTPRQPDPKRGGLQVPVQVRFEEEEPKEAPIETKPSLKEGLTRRVFITDRDLKKYGYTEGCVGCESRLRGPPGRQNRARRNHDETCRRRLEEAMKIDPEDCQRVADADERMTEAIARKVEQEDQKMQREKEDLEMKEDGNRHDQVVPDEPAEEPGHPSSGWRDGEAEGRSYGSQVGQAPMESQEEKGGGIGIGGMEVDRIEKMEPEPPSTTKPSEIHVAELFSEPRVTKWCEDNDLNAGESFDLKTGWDLHRPDHRAAVLEYVRKAKPKVVIGSPPCTMFSRLQNMNGWTEERRQQRRRDLMLLRFAAKVYRVQTEAGRYYVHEHPATASSWNEREIQNLARQENVEKVTSDLCMFGLTTRGSTPEERVAAQKRTIFMTNSPEMARALDRRCDGGHRHQHLVQGRAKQSEEYTDELCQAMCIGVKNQVKWDKTQTKCLLTVKSSDKVGEVPEEEYVHEDAKWAWDDVTGKC